eukprot:2517939-Prymnesium_polylepis.1
MTRGAMGSMSKANEAGMVLVLSVWDDPLSRMLWLGAPPPLPDRNAPHLSLSDARCAATVTLAVAPLTLTTLARSDS